MQVNDYYPFGLTINSYQRVTSKQNDYLYNGKELQDVLDLNWLDYGARMYDPRIGRWHVVYPMADQWDWLSPYQYAQNNPILRVDPTGMPDSIYLDENGKEINRIEINNAEDQIFLLKTTKETDDLYSSNHDPNERGNSNRIKIG